VRRVLGAAAVGAIVGVWLFLMAVTLASYLSQPTIHP
jgi:hypothetical protein